MGPLTSTLHRFSAAFSSSNSSSRSVKPCFHGSWTNPNDIRPILTGLCPGTTVSTGIRSGRGRDQAQQSSIGSAESNTRAAGARGCRDLSGEVLNHGPASLKTLTLLGSSLKSYASKQRGCVSWSRKKRKSDQPHDFLKTLSLLWTGSGSLIRHSPILNQDLTRLWTFFVYLYPYSSHVPVRSFIIVAIALCVLDTHTVLDHQG